MSFKSLLPVFIGVLFSGGFYIFHSARISSTEETLHCSLEENGEESPHCSFEEREGETTTQVQTLGRISPELLLSGGPPKDGIPALDNPAFDNIEQTPFSDKELVVGVYLNDEARAYPYGILNWHEIVNDRIGDTPISVTLCPLCDTTPVFIRKVNGQETTFGVSGKLFQSCLVMYDRLTDSLWSQPWGMGIMGPQTNEDLTRIPAVKTTLGAWKKQYPETKVLSLETGYNRDYFRSPYGSYATDETLIFPIRNQESRSGHPKNIESYIWRADDSQHPKNTFFGDSQHVLHTEAKEKGEIKFIFQGQETFARWDDELQTVRFFQNEEEIPSSTAFAFVYPAFFE